MDNSTNMSDDSDSKPCTTSLSGRGLGEPSMSGRIELVRRVILRIFGASSNCQRSTRPGRASLLGRSHSSSRRGSIGSCPSWESRSDSSDAGMRFNFFSSLRSYRRSLGSDARALRAYCWTKRLSSPASRVFVRNVAMYRSGNNTNHAKISLMPIVDDSSAEVECLFIAGCRLMRFASNDSPPSFHYRL